ncbi:hypothetical protein N7497_011438 [Penicillium chrysogenum]|nr:hypothetical protein N7497_011438 [Penicillium chrysogenum]
MDSALDHYDAGACSDAAMHSRSPYRRPRARKSRGRGLRTTNGCITCRKRHLKCDEVKPICGACAKNNKICEFATSVRSPWRRTNEHQAQLRQTPPLSELREAIVPGWHSSTVDSDLSQPPQLDQLTGSQPDSNQSLVALTDASLSPSNSSFAAIRWFGLLANDAAKDSSQVSTIDNSWVNQGFSLQGHSNPDGQTQLSSLQCATLVLDAPSSIYASDDPTHAGASDGNTLGDEQIWQSREQIELLPGEETLFEHFVTRVSPWIDLFDHTSQFSTFVAHLAIYNAGLMNAILALAYRHLALNPHLSDHNVPNKQEAALQYYYQTLHYVQKAMQYSGYKRSLELLATTLIISAYEMLDNSTKDWERHLEGVFLIQRSQTIHGESGGAAFGRLDIWAAFREKRKTLTFWVPQKPLSELSPHELSRRSIYNTAKVISYCADTVTEADIGRRVDEANHLRKMLDDWQRHLTIEFSPLPLGSGHQSYFRPIWICPPAFAVAVQLFSVSHILLLAHEPSLGGIEQYLRRQSVIKHCVENICGIAVTLKDNPSSIMSSQALYIAGLFAQGHNTREAILELLEACRERSGWPVRSLGEDLQHLWADHEPTKEAAAANLARSIP